MKKIIKYSVLLCSVISYSYLSAHGFETLREMQQYAQEMPEYPEPDNVSWMQPDFSSFYQQFNYSLIQKLFFALGFKKRPLWLASDFKSLLMALTDRKEKEGKSGRYIMHITPKPGDRFVIWGDLEGAYHSLIRDLVELERRGIINDNLELMRPEFSFVFNGNIVNRSPYILETLTVVLQLLKKNPDRVFYIRGSDEDREKWYDFGTKDELEAKARRVSKEKIPLDSELKRFFNTLPLALYLIAEQTEKTVTVVRISHFASSTNEVDESMLGNFFDKSDGVRPVVYKLFDRKPTDKKIIVAAAIKGEDRSWRYTETKGLVRLGFAEGGVSWSLLSAPTGAYRNLYNFFWDAFAILRVRDKLSDWTLSLYNQDVRDQLGFVKDANYQLTTGFEILAKGSVVRFADQVDVLQRKLKDLQKTYDNYQKGCPVVQKQPVERKISQDAEAPLLTDSQQQAQGVYPKKIILGSTGDLKKGLKGYTYPLYAGAQMVFDKVNSAGGYRDKQLELVSFNDNYEPGTAHTNILRFLNEVGTDLIFNPMGSPTILSYLDLIQKGEVLVLFPNTGAVAIHQPDLPYVINFQVSYFKEGQVLAKYAAEKTFARRFAVLYQNDDYGIPPRDGIIKELKRLGIPNKNILQVPYDRNNVNLSDQANQLQKFDPEVLFFLSTSAWAKSLIRYLGAGYFASKKNFGISFLSTKEFRNFMHYKGLSIVFTAQTPSPEHSQIPLVKELRELAQQKNIELDVPLLEGYISAEVLMFLLNKIPEDQSLSKEAIINAARTVVHEDYKGLKLHYNPKTNEINNTIWLGTQDDKDWQAINTLEADTVVEKV